MSDFTVHNFDENLHEKLTELARSNGQTTEEFVRKLLHELVRLRTEPQSGFGSRFAACFAEYGLQRDEQIAEIKGQAVSPPVLEE